MKLMIEMADTVFLGAHYLLRVVPHLLKQIVLRDKKSFCKLASFRASLDSLMMTLLSHHHRHCRLPEVSELLQYSTVLLCLRRQTSYLFVHDSMRLMICCVFVLSFLTGHGLGDSSVCSIIEETNLAQYMML